MACRRKASLSLILGVNGLWQAGGCEFTGVYGLGSGQRRGTSDPVYRHGVNKVYLTLGLPTVFLKGSA